MSPRVFGPDAVADAAEPGLVLDTVRGALVAHAEGRTRVPPPMHLDFADEGGDCHVKAGMVDGADDFAVKIASGFYRNPERGLPVNHGLVCVVSARTGRVRAVLDDAGLLTARRTAAAGALVTHALARPGARTLGVIGAGEQARMQALWLARLRPLDEVLLHGRDAGRTRRACALLAAEGLPARPADAAEAAGADMVVTATPATSPVLDADAVRDGAHVTGIGTDMPHKNELPPALFRRAGLVVTDDHLQCLGHGDFGRAVRVGAVERDDDVAAGFVLKEAFVRPRDAVTVADLTGVGALDAALASAVLARLLGGQPAGRS